MDRFHELRVLLAVAETGGFAKAAARLNSSPPAVTRAIAALEARLGVELFTRTTRRVHPTETGRVLAERARLVLADLEAAEREASGEAALPTGQLTITASVTMGRSVLAPIISDFLDAHPRVTARAFLVDRVVNLIEEGIDVALRVGQLPDSSMMSRAVGEVRRLLVASPGYLERRGTPRAPADLKLHSIIAFSGLMQNREWIYAGERGASRIALQPRFEINDAAAAISGAEAGNGITIALSYMVAKQMREGRLVPVLERYAPPALPVQLVYPESRLIAPKVRAFIDSATPRLRSALAGLSARSRRKSGEERS
ncbi:LysR family transcriptional regulator [Hyphomicrobium sp. NDB2Meth4]|uniref:LysR family transcriptional regulator n=1 Tax=Hyphomicrobium sp. NDB2Meth4 TaxID=1892846 RepID=UPI0009311B6E|nr:LysR family transcriptional regulator [Hyphomicrobium sp. NDB2Meth4]